MEQLFVALTLVMLLSACGGKRTPTSIPTPGLPYVEDLQAALLITADLPAGWIAQPGSTSKELSTLPCGQSLPDVRMVTATVTFETANGAHLSEGITAFHPGDAERWLTSLEDGPQCSAVDVGEQGGTPIAGRVMQPAFPAIGEQSYSLRLTIDGPTTTYFTDLLYVRIGNFIIQIADTTVGAADPDLTTTIVRKSILDFQAARLTP
jgi:hypothetical protein